MKQIVLAEHGGPETLTSEERPPPEPGPGEVRVRTRFAGVNYADVNLRSGRVPFAVGLPLVPGVEGAGEIESVGAGVDGRRVGERVAFLSLRAGGYAQACVVPADHAVRVPDGVSLEAAAAVMLQGITADALLHDVCRVGAGTVVLVHAAAGGTGALLTRWAKRLGGTVLGTTSTAAKADVARDAGADLVVRYDAFVAAGLSLTQGRGVDYVIDGVGAATLAGDLGVLRERGHLVFYGWSGGVPAPVAPMALVPRSFTISGFQIPSFLGSGDASVATRGARVLAGVAEGWLAPRIDHVFALGDVGSAHRALESRETSGKLVLDTS